jgi:hypothetical protein
MLEAPVAMLNFHVLAAVALHEMRFTPVQVPTGEVFDAPADVIVSVPGASRDAFHVVVKKSADVGCRIHVCRVTGVNAPLRP